MIRKFLLSSTLLLFFCLVHAQEQCEPPGDQPPKMGCPDPKGNCPPTGGPGVKIPVQGGKDPNEIVGPAGYDTTKKWVSVKASLPYKVYFENDPEEATGPAQKVIVYLPIHPKLNPASLRLSDFGFGPFNFSVPENTSFYTTRLDVRDSLGLFVDVTAGIDIPNRRAFWIFESIDPATGLAATLPPNNGFLAINDSLTHKGEGYVMFSLQPVSTAHTGDTVAATATIYFDTEDSLNTNTWVNTIDAVAPTSGVNSMPSVVDSVFAVSWSGSDDAGGSGIAYYDLYISKNNGPFALYQQKIDSTHLSFTGDKGATYKFYTLATDFTGNKEGAKTAGEQTVLVSGGGLLVSAKAFLGGAYNASAALMTDSLRMQGILPAAEPYKALGFTAIGNSLSENVWQGLFDSTGSTAITDWVWLELRSSINPTQIIATRSALVRRDGQVVDMDGSSPVMFNKVAQGNYYLALRHRNHLGIMTATALSLNTVTAASIDFTSAATATWGTNARYTQNGVMILWPGDVNGDRKVNYNGTANDKTAVLAKVGAGNPNNLIAGYDRSDANLDGKTTYNGAANDKVVILRTVSATAPNTVITEQIPN